MAVNKTVKAILEQHTSARGVVEADHHAVDADVVFRVKGSGSVAVMVPDALDVVRVAQVNDTLVYANVDGVKLLELADEIVVAGFAASSDASSVGSRLDNVDDFIVVNHDRAPKIVALAGTDEADELERNYATTSGNPSERDRLWFREIREMW